MSDENVHRYAYAYRCTLFKEKMGSTDMKKSLKESKSKTVKYGRYGLIFLIPFFVAFLIFQFYPLLYTIFRSFVFEQKTGRHSAITLIYGLKNYTTYVFTGSSEFWQALGVTVVM